MPNPLPLLIAGGAVLLFLGGVKKKEKVSKVSESKNEETSTEDEIEKSETGAPKLGGGVDGFGTIDRGVRKDKRGHHPWRIYLDDSGYHAQTMLDSSRYSPVQDEIGVSATVGAAKALLRNHFNNLLLKVYPNEKPKDDPTTTRAAMAAKITRT